MEAKRTSEDQNGWRVGDVAVSFDGPFGWAVILGFLVWDSWTEAILARPMIHAHYYGAPEATPLLSMERYTANVDRLVRPPGREGKPSRLLGSDFALADLRK